MNKSSIGIIILAAGKGTRMKSSLPKTLHKIADREMLNLVIDSAKAINPTNITIIISHNMQQFIPKITEQHLNTNLNFVIQDQQLGTAHAVETGVKSLTKINDIILVLYGDTPLIKAGTLKSMIKNIVSKESAICVLGFDCQKENKYGRLVIKNDQLVKIVEFKDSSKGQQLITLCNSGVMAIDGSKINKLLSKINNKNSNKEFYLTDIVHIAKLKNFDCNFIKTNQTEVIGVNTRLELSKAEQIKQKELRQQFMKEGVTMINPKSIHFAFDTKISKDVTIHPNVVFGCNVKIYSNECFNG